MERQHAGLLIAAAVLAVFVIVDSQNPIMFRSLGFDGKGGGGVMMNGGADFYAYNSLEATSSAPESQKAYLSINDESLGGAAANVEQKIIKTADLELQVDSAVDAAKSLADIAASKGGFVASSSVSEDAYGIKYGWVSIRVPVADFDASITAAKALAEKVISESQDGQDVTEEFTDLEARLGAAEAQEAQYLTILESASTVGEVLAVQEHLAQVRSEIESLKGQINYLENRTSLSTISVSLTEETHVAFPTEKFDLGDEIKDAARTLVGLFQKLVIAIIWLVIIGAPVALVAFGAYKATMAIKHRR